MRAGDTVFHRPTGERWIVAYVDGKYLSWSGWPEGLAEVADCVLIRACSDDEHRAELEAWSRPGRDGLRSRKAREALFELNQGYIGAGI